MYIAGRDGRRTQPTEGHVRVAGPPHVRTSGPSHIGTTSRTGRGSRGCSWVAHGVVVVPIDETLSCIPMFGQSRCDRCIVVEDPGISLLTEPKQDGDHNRYRGESHDHKDAGYRAFIMEEALHK